MKQKNPLIFLVHDIHDRKLRRISSPNQRKYNSALYVCCAKALGAFRFLYKSVFDQVEIRQTFLWLYLYRFLYKIACTNFKGKKRFRFGNLPPTASVSNLLQIGIRSTKSNTVQFDRPFALLKTQTSTFFSKIYMSTPATEKSPVNHKIVTNQISILILAIQFGNAILKRKLNRFKQINSQTHRI